MANDYDFMLSVGLDINMKQAIASVLKGIPDVQKVVDNNQIYLKFKPDNKSIINVLKELSSYDPSEFMKAVTFSLDKKSIDSQMRVLDDIIQKRGEHAGQDLSKYISTAIKGSIQEGLDVKGKDGIKRIVQSITGEYGRMTDKSIYNALKKNEESLKSAVSPQNSKDFTALMNTATQIEQNIVLWNKYKEVVKSAYTSAREAAQKAVDTGKIKPTEFDAEFKKNLLNNERYDFAKSLTGAKSYEEVLTAIDSRIKNAQANLSSYYSDLGKAINSMGDIGLDKMRQGVEATLNALLDKTKSFMSELVSVMELTESTIGRSTNDIANQFGQLGEVFKQVQKNSSQSLESLQSELKEVGKEVNTIIENTPTDGKIALSSNEISKIQQFVRQAYAMKSAGMSFGSDEIKDLYSYISSEKELLKAAGLNGLRPDKIIPVDEINKRMIALQMSFINTGGSMGDFITLLQNTGQAMGQVGVAAEGAQGGINAVGEAAKNAEGYVTEFIKKFTELEDTVASKADTESKIKIGKKENKDVSSYENLLLQQQSQREVLVNDLAKLYSNIDAQTIQNKILPQIGYDKEDLEIFISDYAEIIALAEKMRTVMPQGTAADKGLVGTGTGVGGNLNSAQFERLIEILGQVNIEISGIAKTLGTIDEGSDIPNILTQINELKEGISPTVEEIRSLAEAVKGVDFASIRGGGATDTESVVGTLKEEAKATEEVVEAQEELKAVKAETNQNGLLTGMGSDTDKIVSNNDTIQKEIIETAEATEHTSERIKSALQLILLNYEDTFNKIMSRISEFESIGNKRGQLFKWDDPFYGNEEFHNGIYDEFGIDVNDSETYSVLQDLKYGNIKLKDVEKGLKDKITNFRKYVKQLLDYSNEKTWDNDISQNAQDEILSLFDNGELDILLSKTMKEKVSKICDKVRQEITYGSDLEGAYQSGMGHEGNISGFIRQLLPQDQELRQIVFNILRDYLDDIIPSELHDLVLHKINESIAAGYDGTTSYPYDFDSFIDENVKGAVEEMQEIASRSDELLKLRENKTNATRATIEAQKELNKVQSEQPNQNNLLTNVEETKQQAEVTKEAAKAQEELNVSKKAEATKGTKTDVVGTIEQLQEILTVLQNIHTLLESDSNKGFMGLTPESIESIKGSFDKLNGTLTEMKGLIGELKNGIPSVGQAAEKYQKGTPQPTTPGSAKQNQFKKKVTDDDSISKNEVDATDRAKKVETSLNDYIQLYSNMITEVTEFYDSKDKLVRAQIKRVEDLNGQRTVTTTSVKYDPKEKEAFRSDIIQYKYGDKFISAEDKEALKEQISLVDEVTKAYETYQKAYKEQSVLLNKGKEHEANGMFAEVIDKETAYNEALKRLQEYDTKHNTDLVSTFEGVRKGIEEATEASIRYNQSREEGKELDRQAAAEAREASKPKKTEPKDVLNTDNLTQSKNDLKDFTDRLEKAGLLTDDVKAKLKPLQEDINKVGTNKELSDFNAKLDDLKKNSDFGQALSTVDKLDTKKLEGFFSKIKTVTNGKESGFAGIRTFIDSYGELFNKLDKETGNVIEGLIAKNERLRESFNQIAQASMGDYTQKLDTNIQQYEQMATETASGNLQVGNLEGFVAKLNEYKAAVADVKKYNLADIFTMGEAEREQFIKGLTEAKAKVGELGKDLDKGFQLARDTAQSNLDKKVADWLTKNTAASSEFRSQMEAIAEQLKKPLSVEQLRALGAEFNKIDAAAIRAGQTGLSFFDQWKKSASGLMRYLSTYVSFYRIIGYFRQGIEIVKQYNDALKEMKKVTTDSYNTLRQFQKESFNMGSAVGTTAIDIQKATAQWLRLGESLTEAGKSAQESAKLYNISEFDSIENAAKGLTSVSQAYSDVAKSDIVDMLVGVGDSFPIAVDGLTEGLSRSAAALKQSGNDIQEAMALMVGAIIYGSVYGNIHVEYI